MHRGSLTKYRVLIVFVLIWSMSGQWIVFAQTTAPIKNDQDRNRAVNLQENSPTDDLEIAVFDRQEKKSQSPAPIKSAEPTALTPEAQKPAEIAKPAQDENETQAETSPEFLADFGALPESVTSDKSDLIEEDFSLSVDGAMIPGAKLFSQLVAEAEAKRLEEERLKERSSVEQENAEQPNTAAGQTGSYLVRKTTIVTTRTSYGNSGVNSRLSDLPAVSAGVIATNDAYQLVRLASRGDGAPLPVEWAQTMVEAGRLHRIDPVLILEVCRQESRFKNNARSGANAHGLMQFIPATAARFGIDPYNPRQAIFGGAKYLRFLIDTLGGDIRSALAGYNAGEGAVIAFASGRTIYARNGKVINGRGIRTPFGIPPYAETQNYVATIYSKYLNSLNNLRGL